MTSVRVLQGHKGPVRDIKVSYTFVINTFITMHHHGGTGVPPNGLMVGHLSGCSGFTGCSMAEH